MKNNDLQNEVFRLACEKRKSSSPQKNGIRKPKITKAGHSSHFWTQRFRKETALSVKRRCLENIAKAEQREAKRNRPAPIPFHRFSDEILRRFIYDGTTIRNAETLAPCPARQYTIHNTKVSLSDVLRTLTGHPYKITATAYPNLDLLTLKSANPDCPVQLDAPDTQGLA